MSSIENGLRSRSVSPHKQSDEEKGWHSETEDNGSDSEVSYLHSNVKMKFKAWKHIIPSMTVGAVLGSVSTSNSELSILTGLVGAIAGGLIGGETYNCYNSASIKEQEKQLNKQVAIIQSNLHNDPYEGFMYIVCI